MAGVHLVGGSYYHAHCYGQQRKNEELAALLKRAIDVLERVEKKLG
jgi:hypothetical protein